MTKTLTVFLIGHVFCPNTKRSGKLCLHNKTFQSLGRSDYKCPQCGSVCQVRDIPFEEQTNSFSLSLGQGVYIVEEIPKSVQDVFVESIVLVSIVPTERNANLLEVK